MKKSNTLFTLAFFAILAFSSCEREQWGNAQKGPDDIDNRAEGQIGLSALKVSVDEKTATTVTRAGINTDNFIIRIYDMDKEGKMVQIQRDARNIHAKGKPLQYHSHVSRSTTGRVRKALLLLQTGF